MDGEMKVCSSCGRMLPVERFHKWTNKDGKVNYLHQCLKCQRDKANHRYSAKKRFGILAVFSDDDLIIEIKRRKLFVVEHIPNQVLLEELKRRRT